MAFWDFDHDSFAWLYPPVRRRIRKFIAWLRALISQAKYIFLQLKGYRTTVNYDLAHNSQVCFMEAALNDTFDTIPRRIYIDDGAVVDPEWWALDSETAPVWWALDSETIPTKWPLDSEVDASFTVFLVHVPGGLVYDPARMQAMINKYKLPGTRGVIVSP